LACVVQYPWRKFQQSPSENKKFEPLTRFLLFLLALLLLFVAEI
jgi:hypothetical protein